MNEIERIFDVLLILREFFENFLRISFIITTKNNDDIIGIKIQIGKTCSAVPNGTIPINNE